MKASRGVRVAAVITIAVGLMWASSVVSVAAAKKPYTADVAPHSVSTGSTPTFTLTVTNKALTQTLGSCNLTAPSGFTLGEITSQPTVGTATIVGNAVQLRNLNTVAATSRSVDFTATVPSTPGTYAWAIDCRQANNYSPDKPSNQFGLDAANSNLNTTVESPLPNADVAVTANTDSQDPITAANTVVYTVTVGNFGPATSGSLTLTDSLPSGGSITSAGGTNWTCSGSGGQTTCTHAAIDSGVTAETVSVYVLTPDANTTITNRASIAESGANDPNGGNNTLDQSTTVNKNTNCGSGNITCGTGTITYSLPSQVQACQAPSITVFLCGKVSFAAVPNTVGSQTWSWFAPRIPEAVCPLNFTSNILTTCDWEAILQPIAVQYPGGATIAEFDCHSSKCPVGALPGAGTIVVHIGDGGAHTILPQCNSGDTRICFTQARVSGNLRIRVFNMKAGDPKIAGRCIAGC
jgi:uncharacterized repeat protein (TIGR01451 family)